MVLMDLDELRKLYKEVSNLETMPTQNLFDFILLLRI